MSVKYLIEHLPNHILFDFVNCFENEFSIFKVSSKMAASMKPIFTNMSFQIISDSQFDIPEVFNNLAWIVRLHLHYASVDLLKFNIAGSKILNFTLFHQFQYLDYILKTNCIDQKSFFSHLNEAIRCNQFILISGPLSKMIRNSVEDAFPTVRVIHFEESIANSYCFANHLSQIYPIDDIIWHGKLNMYVEGSQFSKPWFLKL